MPRTRVMITNITRKLVPGIGKPHLLKNSPICVARTFPFSSYSPTVKIAPATKPPSRTRPKLILPIIVSSLGFDFGAPDEYHRIDLEARLIGPGQDSDGARRAPPRLRS